MPVFVSQQNVHHMQNASAEAAELQSPSAVRIAVRAAVDACSEGRIAASLNGGCVFSTMMCRESLVRLLKTKEAGRIDEYDEADEKSCKDDEKEVLVVLVMSVCQDKERNCTLK